MTLPRARIWPTSVAGALSLHFARVRVRVPSRPNHCRSVYHDVPREGYWVDREDNPSPLMKQSLLYKLHTYKIHKNHNAAIEKCGRFRLLLLLLLCTGVVMRIGCCWLTLHLQILRARARKPQQDGQGVQVTVGGGGVLRVTCDV